MVYGVSVDSWATLGELRKQLELPFNLLSDWRREVAPRYGTFDEAELIAERRTFLIDKTGHVRFMQYAGLSEARDHEAVMAAVRALP